MKLRLTLLGYPRYSAEWNRCRESVYMAHMQLPPLLEGPMFEDAVC